MVVMRPAQEWEATYIGACLRAEDEREVQSATGQSGVTAVPLSFLRARECYTVRSVEGGKVATLPCAIYGVADGPEPGLGIVWLLATDGVRRCALSLIREAPCWLDHIGRHYATGLYNVADERNSLHIRWCELTGFSIGKQVSVNGAPFRYIYRPRNHVR